MSNDQIPGLAAFLPAEVVGQADRRERPWHRLARRLSTQLFPGHWPVSGLRWPVPLSRSGGGLPVCSLQGILEALLSC
jgi:hypothetical protein